MKIKVNNKLILSCLLLVFIFAVKAHGQRRAPDMHGTWVLSTSNHSNVLPDTIRILPSRSDVKLANDPRKPKYDTNPRSLIRNDSLVLIYNTTNKWTDTCKIELLDKSKIKGSGVWRPTDGRFENAEKFKVTYSFLPEICSNHPEGHIAKNPKERDELTEKKHCTGFHAL